MTTTDRRRWRRTTTAGVAAVVLALPLAGCGDESRTDDPDDAPRGAAEPADPTSAAERPEATFEATVTPGSDALEVTYTIRNEGDTELLLVNRVPRPAGAGVRYEPDLAYVTGRDDGVLLSHRAFPWPDPSRVDWDAAPRVGVTSLPGGETTRVELAVPLPLERRQPFGEDLGYGPIRLPDPAREATFCLGVIAPPYAPALGLQREPEGDTIGHGNAAHDAQYLFCSDPVPLEG